VSLLVDTSRLGPDERADALHQMLTGATAAHDLRLLGPPERVHARLEHWSLSSDVAVLQQVSSGISHTRTERHARHDGPERVVFVLHDGGPGRYLHEGRMRTLDRGGLYVTDLNSRYSYTRPGDGTARIVQIERSALGMTVEQVQSAAGRLIASPLYGLLRAHIAELCASAPRLSRTGESATVATATAALAGSLLRTTTEVTSAVELHRYLVQRVLAFMTINFAYAELSADIIAREHHVSKRHLFKVWSTQPESLAETLVRIRLEKAKGLLTSGPSLPVGAVAHYCGFTDASHFSRRFRQAYGVSPVHYRRGARECD
jgi:AraC-like DNA-binding protein